MKSIIYNFKSSINRLTKNREKNCQLPCSETRSRFLRGATAFRTYLAFFHKLSIKIAPTGFPKFCPTSSCQVPTQLTGFFVFTHAFLFTLHCWIECGRFRTKRCTFVTRNPYLDILDRSHLNTLRRNLSCSEPILKLSLSIGVP